MKRNTLVEERWREVCGGVWHQEQHGRSWVKGDVMRPRNNEDTFTLVCREIGFQLKTRHFS